MKHYRWSKEVKTMQKEELVAFKLKNYHQAEKLKIQR